MSEPYIGEVRMFGFTFNPRGWANCDGAILPIEQNQALFSILGNNYGGDGRTTFGLPELRGRTPMHVGSGFSLGQKSGEERHFLNVNEMPAHKHSVQFSNGASSSDSPDGELPATAEDNVYGTPGALVSMNGNAIANNSGGQGHENMQPFLTIRFCIAITGTFPPRN
jgi:microcystin-dependent protein